MESGEFSRGKESIRAYGSIVMVGNFDVDVQHQQRVGHLFGPMPPEMRNDTALMDRIHCYLPGWDVPKISEAIKTEPLRPGLRLPQRVLDPAAVPQPGFGPARAADVRRCAQRPRPERGQQDDQRPAQADPPVARRPGPRRRPGMGGAAGAGMPAPGQGAAEADRLRRVPQHAVQLHAGQGRRREVRGHAGTPERGSRRPRSAAARPGVGHQPRRSGRGLGPVPHRGHRRTGQRRPHPEPPGAAGVLRVASSTPKQNLYAEVGGAGRRPQPKGTRVLRSSCGRTTPARAGSHSGVAALLAMCSTLHRQEPAGRAGRGRRAQPGRLDRPPPQRHRRGGARGREGCHRSS